MAITPLQTELQDYFNGLCCASTPVVTVPTITYPVPPGGMFSFTVNQAINTLCPTILTGTAPITITISPSLPAGLSINPTTGCITGTPTSPLTVTTFDVTATNSGGSDTATFNMVVNAATVPVAPTITYPNIVENLISGNPVNICPTTLSGDIPIVVSVSPSLPAGLTLDSNTGCITGTPTATVSLTTFTFTATNSVGTDTFDMDISTTLLPITIKNHSLITDQASGDAYMALALSTGSAGILASSWDSATNTYQCEVPLGSTVGSLYFDGVGSGGLANSPFNAGGEYHDPSGLITTYTGSRHFAEQDGIIVEIGGDITFGDTAFRSTTNSTITLNNFKGSTPYPSGVVSSRFGDGTTNCVYNFKGKIGSTSGDDLMWDSGFLPSLSCNINARVSVDPNNNSGAVEGDLAVLEANTHTINYIL